MERLTYYDSELGCYTAEMDGHFVSGEVIDRLAVYENAEELGSLVYLPCKIGDTVYCVNKHLVDVSDSRMEWQTCIEAKKFSVCLADEIGKTVFLTRKEAESALKAKQDS